MIIIDECDQVFWHLLNSGTEVQKRRVSVLKNLKQLVQNVLGSSQGKIYLSSADVSDTDVKYVLSLAGEYRVNPFVIVNNYRESVLAGLVEDGYTIIDASDADDDESGAVIESIKAASVELYAAECQA
ncbi:MAG: hypothetical protein ICV54_27840 [Nostoc sp. C3-bin3]|nr:hypothetical protein [Nostoc sp. C3-bin3]